MEISPIPTLSKDINKIRESNTQSNNQLMAIRPKIKTFGYATIIYGFSNLLTKIVAVYLPLSC